MTQSAPRRYRRINESIDPLLAKNVAAALGGALARQPIMRGERLPGVVKRLCPEVLEMGAEAGLSVDLDLVENTHSALRRGFVYFVLRRNQKRMN